MKMIRKDLVFFHCLIDLIVVVVKFVLNFLVDKLYSVDCEIEWIKVGEQDWSRLGAI